MEGASRVPLACPQHGPDHGHDAVHARDQPVGLDQRLHGWIHAGNTHDQRILHTAQQTRGSILVNIV